jgi:hypothetical protein
MKPSKSKEESTPTRHGRITMHATYHQCCCAEVLELEVLEVLELESLENLEQRYDRWCWQC